MYFQNISILILPFDRGLRIIKKKIKKRKGNLIIKKRQTEHGEKVGLGEYLLSVNLFVKFRALC